MHVTRVSPNYNQNKKIKTINYSTNKLGQDSVSFGAKKITVDELMDLYNESTKIVESYVEAWKKKGNPIPKGWTPTILLKTEEGNTLKIWKVQYSLHLKVEDQNYHLLEQYGLRDNGHLTIPTKTSFRYAKDDETKQVKNHLNKLIAKARENYGHIPITQEL